MKRKFKLISLPMNVIAIIVTFAMLITGTFAWFTDSATSSGNIIKSGNLDVEMYWAEGCENPETTNWVDASTGAIFNYDNWEPGYVEARHIKIANEGTLALKYKVKFIANGEVSELADVIEVYYCDPATQVVDRASLTDEMKIGTLSEVLAGMEETASGNLVAGSNHSITLALKMNENAGNEYQGLSIGTNFAIQLLATQLSSEEDDLGSDYDNEAGFVAPATTVEEFFNAIDAGEDVLLSEQIKIDGDLVNYMAERYTAATFSREARTQVIDSNVSINGNGSTIYRTEEMAGAPMFSVEEGYTLTLSNIVVDGGAVWTGAADTTLQRGTINAGITTSANIVAVGIGAHLVLEEGAILQNNSGANAVALTRNANGSSLTLNGGEIINNTSAAGAIWGGGKIVLNSGKISYNHATSIGGGIRMLDNNAGNTISFTMNGGEMNHNKSNGSGGAIWGGNNAKYYLNGGEMAYNEAGSGGGAIWGGLQEVFYITGDFAMHHNVAGELGNAIRLSHYRWIPVELEMTGGHIYANDANGGCAIYANNNPVVLNGGIVDDVISYNGDDYITVGNTKIDGCLEFNHDGRGDYKILLGETFEGFNFVVEVEDALFPKFMLDPADGYVYTEGDELKLVCLNEGYETYWDADAKVFRLQAKSE